MTSGPLAGLRVIDASTVIAGPLAAMSLGDYGAEVIKVEHPQMGDPLRGHGPAVDGVGLWWKIMARNKRTVGLLLGDPAGADVFDRLAAGADVVIENFRPGTLERWGIGPDRLFAANPGLVLVRVTGFGQHGPYRDRPGFGTLAEALSGFASINGQPDGPPTLPPFGLADCVAASNIVSAALMALRHRDQTGEGQVVDLNLIEPILQTFGPLIAAHHALGTVPTRTGNRSPNSAPRNAYRTGDNRWVVVSSAAQAIAARLLVLVGHPEVVDEPWFATGKGRADHVDELDGYVGEWMAARTTREIIDACEQAEVAAAPMHDLADLAADVHVRETAMLAEVADADLGTVHMQGLPFRLSATPGAIRHTGRSLGADTDAVLAELGIDAAARAELRASGVIA